MARKHVSMLVHFVWSATRREPWLVRDWREDLHGYIGGIMKGKKAKLITAGSVSDHIHLYASMPTTISVADFVNAVKSNSSRWIHGSFPKARGFSWQEGYGAFSVSKSQEKKVIEYILGQEEHHKRRSFKREFMNLVEKHEIDDDPRYMWD